MPTVKDLKQAACAEIDRRAAETIDFGEDIFRHAELGFKEHRTARLVAERFRDLGLSYRDGLAVTGIKAVVSSGRPGPRVAVLGELDALVVPDHPCALTE